MIIDELFEAPQLCPECGGISFSDLILAEKKDACYHKVKASAKVWPSAYASGRLVQCRKKGAANYGNSKNESVAKGWKDVVAGGAMALGALGSGAQTMPNINAQQVELANKYYNVLVQRAKEDGKELDTRTLNLLKAKAQDAAAKKTQQPTQQQGFPSQGSERKVAKDAGQFESQGMAETRRGQVPMTLNPGETDNLEPENIAGFRQLPAYKQGQAAQQKAGKQLIQKSPYTFQSDQDWAYRQGATDAQRAAMFANFGGTKPLTTEEGEQQKGADYRDPKEVDYDDEYDAMVARVKKLAGLGPMKTVYDPKKRQYRNMPTAQQPKK
jgi:hypothetical protein